MLKEIGLLKEVTLSKGILLLLCLTPRRNTGPLRRWIGKVGLLLLSGAVFSTWGVCTNYRVIIPFLTRKKDKISSQIFIREIILQVSECLHLNICLFLKSL